MKEGKLIKQTLKTIEALTNLQNLVKLVKQSNHNFFKENFI